MELADRSARSVLWKILQPLALDPAYPHFLWMPNTDCLALPATVGDSFQAGHRGVFCKSLPCEVLVPKKSSDLQYYLQLAGKGVANRQGWWLLLLVEQTREKERRERCYLLKKWCQQQSSHFVWGMKPSQGTTLRYLQDRICACRRSSTTGSSVRAKL